jgi:allantoicase
VASNLTSEAAFRGLVDLAAEQLGGRALYANDEFFAEKENLLKAGRGVFIEGKYTDRGKWMDGWESRRKRDLPGHDFCVIRLGVPGVARGVDIDTNHFLGNHPPYAALDGAFAAATADPLAIEWREILPRSPLKPGSQNFFALPGGEPISHVRLRIYPDGGVARLRVYGDPHVDAAKLEGRIDLAALTSGARAITASDMFFGNVEQLILPGRPENMGGGWETRRRRGPGHDWAIVKLAARGFVEEIEVDTCHFKGNYPDRCSLDACVAPAEPLDALNWQNAEWVPILGERKLAADTIHRFGELVELGPWDYVRLNIFPDGGVARLRCWGKVERR